MSLRSLKDGELLYKPGDIASALFQVVSGLIVLKRCNSEGGEYLATFHGPGECFGELPLLVEQQVRGFAAEARGATEIACLDKKEFDQIALEHPQIYQQLCRKLCKIITSLLQQVELSSQASLRQRLANLIIDACKRHGKTNDNGININIPLSQTDIGNMLGVTRQSVQRELRSWRENGWVGRSGGQIVVNNIKALEQEAANFPAL